jgi:hypothetical protein
MTEGLLLSLFGAAAGVPLAWAGSRVLVNLCPIVQREGTAAGGFGVTVEAHVT